MNRYCYLVMLCGLIVAPCFAMLNPGGFGQFGSSAPQGQPELLFTPGSVYREHVVTSDQPSPFKTEELSEEPEGALTPIEEPFEQTTSPESSPQEAFLPSDLEQLHATLESLSKITKTPEIFEAIQTILRYQAALISSAAADNSAIITNIKNAFVTLSARQVMENSTINTLLEAEGVIQQLLGISPQHALQGMHHLQQIALLLASDDPTNKMEQAKVLLQKMRELLTTPEPTAPTPAQPHPMPSATPLPSPQQTPINQPAPIAPSTPVVGPPPAKPTAPSKAHENITKANSKLSSALRRLDAIKGYYKEIGQEDRKVIKIKAENVLKEYEKGITKFAQRIGQVKNELGDRVDKEKLAPFNTFIELVNKLSRGIKGL